MSKLILELAQMSYMAVWLIMAVMLFRVVMRRAPKWMACLLWGVVALRLVLPFQVESAWSLVPVGAIALEGSETSDVTVETVKEEDELIVDGSLQKSRSDLRANSDNRKVSSYELSDDWFYEADDTASRGQMAFDKYNAYLNSKKSTEQQQSMHTYSQKSMRTGSQKRIHNRLWSIVTKNITTIAAIWIIGCVILLTYGLLDFLRMKRLVAQSVPLQENVCLCDEIDSPFILGIRKPRIYLPSKIDQSFYDVVLQHEYVHLKRMDHIWKPLGFIILCLHWMNPLCWFAYLLFCRDVEFACDERATANLSRQEKADYCQILLRCSANGGMRLSMPVAFGEVGVKKRVKAVMKRKKAGIGVMLAAILLGVVVVACFATTPNTSNENHVARVLDSSEQSNELGKQKEGAVEDKANDKKNDAGKVQEVKGELIVVSQGNDHGKSFEQLAKENIDKRQKEQEALQAEWEEFVKSKAGEDKLVDGEMFENVWMKRVNLGHNDDGGVESNATKIYVQKSKESDTGKVLVRLPDNTIYGFECSGARAGWRNYYLMKESDGRCYLWQLYYDYWAANQLKLYYQIFDFNYSSTGNCGSNVIDEGAFEANGDFSVKEFNEITAKTDELLKKSQLLIGTLGGEMRVGPVNDYERCGSKQIYRALMEEKVDVGGGEYFAYLVDYKYGEGFILDYVQMVDCKKDLESVKALGLTNEQTKNRYYVYNGEIKFASVKESEDCIYTIMEHKGKNSPKRVSRTELVSTIKEKTKAGIPFRIVRKNNEIIEISEVYIP